MVNLEQFTEGEIPFRTLAKFGLTQEMIEDLPQSVMAALLSSRWTTRLPIIMENEYGERFLAKARIRMVRRTDGEVDIVFAPYCDKDKPGGLTGLTDEQTEALKNGRVVIADITTREDSQKHQRYVQLDKELNQTMHVPVEVIMQNINMLADNYGLDDTDKEYIAKCEIHTLNSGTDKPISIGIDLNEESAIRIVPGTAQEWLIAQDESDIEHYTIGLYGCWVRDEYGDMHYVYESDFTPEIAAEANRRSAQNGARAQMTR